MDNDSRTKDELSARRPCTVKEWTAAWKAFQTACKNLQSLADRDGDLLTIDVKLKPFGKRRGKRS